jgi:AraC-like DNA-binding protein
MSTRTISIHHIRAALSGARRKDLDVVPLLRKAGISPALLEDSRARVTAEQAAALVSVLVAGLDDEFMGLGPARSRRGTFAMMCHAAVHSPDLRTALERATTFYALFPGTPGFRILEEDGDARVAMDISGAPDPDHFMAEGIMLVWHALSSWLIGRRISLRHMEFCYPEPPHSGEYDLIFGCPSYFGLPVTAVVFEQKFLTMPVVRDEAAVVEFLRSAPGDLVATPDYATSAGESVRRILSQALPSRMPPLESAAERLSVSPQTLRRRLADQGTSYRAIKDELRRDIAIAALTRGEETVEDLAHRLGFSEPSAFHRAFKRWTGSTPGAYRTSTS